jgi:hypothetical protein
MFGRHVIGSGYIFVDVPDNGLEFGKGRSGGVSAQPVTGYRPRRTGEFGVRLRKVDVRFGLVGCTGNATVGGGLDVRCFGLRAQFFCQFERGNPCAV